MTWTRAAIKSNAKQVLSRTLGKSIGVTVVGEYLMLGAFYLPIYFYLLSFIYSMIAVLASAFSEFAALPQQYQYSGIVDSGTMDSFGNFFLTLSSSTLSIGSIFMSLIAFFIAFPITVGITSFFIRSRNEDAPFSSFLSGFKKGSYLRNVGTGFLKGLYVFLWSLLFIIPGIIKSYSYYMVEYIIAQNPNISAQRAFELSKKMTKGEKWKIFVLDLSFIGWDILSALTAGMGNILLTPYKYAAYTELFAALRTKAIAEGYTTAEELGNP